MLVFPSLIQTVNAPIEWVTTLQGYENPKDRYEYALHNIYDLSFIQGKVYFKVV